MTLTGCQLLEYRPGLYAWVDAGGKVIRKATETEADAHLAQLAGQAADLDGANGAHVAGLPLFAVENTDRAAPTSTAPKPNGKGKGGAHPGRLSSARPAAVATETPSPGGNGDQVPHQVEAPTEAQAMPSGNGDRAPEQVPTVPTNGAGKMGSVDVPGPVYFVAYRDHGNRDGMIPTSTGGRLLVYPTLDDARADSGALGVGSAQRWPRIVELCNRHGLALPEVGGNGDGKKGGNNE